MRDNDDDVPSRNILLYMADEESAIGQPILRPVDVTVFGSERQPFITEVYTNDDTLTDFGGLGPNPRGYFAIELFNPYDKPINMNGWALGLVDRRRIDSGNASPSPDGAGGARLEKHTVRLLKALDGSFTIPANSYL